MAFSLANQMASLAIRNSTSTFSRTRSQMCKSSSTALFRSCPSSHLSTCVGNGSYFAGEIRCVSSTSVSKPQTLQSSPSQSFTIRDLSTTVQTKSQNEFMQEDGTVLATGPDGTKYSIPLKPLGNYNQARHAPKIAPRVVNSRISKLRTIDGSAKQIRHSPWRLNLVCQFAARETTTVEDALEQLQYVNKVKAPLVSSLIQGTANSAMTKYGLLPSQIEVAECFATQGTHMKRIKTMGRGRAGKMYRRHSHIRLVLREIDFPLKIMQCTSINERKQWVKKMEIALRDQSEYKKERDEIEALEKEAAEMRKKKEEKE